MAAGDDVNPNEQPKRRKVLRAADVIPPFDQVESRPADDGAIPTYDLAENILAEQRRAAGRRRRAPGRVEEEPVPRPDESAVSTPRPQPMSQDLLELQQIVAQIVARDIERLCQRPDRRVVTCA